MLVSYGFADNGERWVERGGSLGLFNDLAAQGNEFRDWFVDARWTKSEPKLLPIPAEVYPSQDFLSAETVSHYVNVGDTDLDEKKPYEVYPTIMRWKNDDGKVEFFVFQGTHRLAALKVRGEQLYKGWLVDVDKSGNIF